MSYMDINVNIEADYSMILSENQDLTPVTPNDPMLTSDLVTQVEGLKLMIMCELHGYAMLHLEEIMQLSVKIKI